MRILITGAKGMLGHALVEKLIENNKDEIIGVDKDDFNLLKTSQVVKMYKQIKPDKVIHCANVVAGILYNLNNKFDILYKNTNINNNVISLAVENNIQKLMFISSTCALPVKNSPLSENDFMMGQVADQNDAYAISKIHGFYLCKSAFETRQCNFITVCPTNMYGEGERFDPKTGHAIVSIIYKIMESKETGKEVVLFGDGEPMRDWLYVGDAIEQMLWIFKNYNNPRKMVCLSTKNYIRNIDLVKKICEFMKYDYRKIKFDGNKGRNGVQNKITDVSYLEGLMGKKVFTDFEWISLKRVCNWYQKNYKWNGVDYIFKESLWVK